MPGRINDAGHRAAIAKLAEAASQKDLLREHLRVVTESPKFKSSRRSQEFLRYVVVEALEGRSDDLKERSLGAHLFGRPASYDTGEDAIVRVTASDVRRRLHQYYEDAPESEFRIDLPPGSYIPEFVHRPPRLLGTADGGAALRPMADQQVLPLSAPQQPIGWRHLGACAIAGLALGLCLSAGILYRQSHPGARLILPWSILFQNDRPTQLVVCDTNVSMLQSLLGTNLSLSDYANRRFVQNPATLGPDLQRAAGFLGGMDYTAATAFLDVTIALNISELARPWGYHLAARSARALQLRDFRTDDNFILLGSPRSNPWSKLFQDQLDFAFVYDAVQNQEVCRNLHPRRGELATYIPTAMGGGTGEAYAIVAFLANPEQSGHILLLAGSNAEGTEAASKLVTNIDLLSQTLIRSGIDPHASKIEFEALLRVTVFAGSPNRFVVVAFHRLGEVSPPAPK